MRVETIAISEVGEKLTLRAGPLSLFYTDGGLRGLTLGGREVLRRIYAAVRDHNWGTVPAVLSDVVIDAQADHFQIAYRADHRQGDIRFVRRGRITGEADGTVTFTMDGRAETAFRRNRIGCCVLHPIAECAGRPCRVTHADGSIEASAFPDAISPHQPFRQVRGLAHEVLPGLWAEVTFDGDVFETEDQRNWTDASFKTYSTPLDIPFPVPIPAGTTVRQVVTLRLRGPLPPFAPAPNAVAVQITLPNRPATPLPRLGLGLAADGGPLTARAAERLRALHLDHLRVDLTLSDPSYPALLERAASKARAVGARLLVALHLSEEAAAELGGLRDLLGGSERPLGGWLVFAQSAACTPEGLPGLARTLLGEAAPEARFLGGTDAYFAQLNRARPALTDADGAAYSVNPQVHAFDDESLMETPVAQAATVRSARRLYPSLALWVSPVTLKPRFNPDATGPRARRPPEADSRQRSALAAAWTVASVKHLAEAGAAGLTYFETTGARGVMEADGTVFPVYQALADIGDDVGGEVLPSVSSHPERVECLALRRDGRTRVILANQTAESQWVVLGGLFDGEERTLPPYAVAVLTSEVSCGSRKERIV